jgi:thiol-disulfide isomerase/thioredoxin
VQDILLRAGWALAIAALAFLAYWAWTRIQISRLRKPTGGLEAFVLGQPGILYFTTPDCVPCKTQQRPAFKKLTQDFGVKVQIIEIDATQRPDLADYWGVLSVPTTFIIDSKLQPRGINHGVASAEKLKKQVESAESGLRSRSKKGAASNSAVIEKVRSIHVERPAK